MCPSESGSAAVSAAQFGSFNPGRGPMLMTAVAAAFRHSVDGWRTGEIVRAGSIIIPLAHRPGDIQAYKLVRPAGHDDDVPDLRSHEGYDWAYVLNGTLRLVLGDHDLLRQAGEAAEFDTRTPHWFGATSSEPVEYLSLVGRQGQRAHIRATTDRR